jgi:hypothetical protein
MLHALMNPNALQYMQAVVCLLLSYQFFNEPVDYVPDDLVAPMLNRVAFPFKYEGTAQKADVAIAGISMIGWLLLCDRFASGVVGALDSFFTF